MTRPTTIAALIALLFCPPALADERDDAIFGGPDAEETREADIFGESDTAEPSKSLESRFEDSLEERSATTQIGGLGYLQFAMWMNEEDPISQTSLFSPALLDLYVDGRPNDRIRLYARARARHSFGASPDLFGLQSTQDDAGKTDVELDQLWLKFDIAQTVYMTVGQQPIRWGAGRFWNPTDFLHSQVRNPLDVFDDRNGVSLIKAHFPIESLGWNLYAVMNLEGLEKLEDTAGALRAEILLGQTELSLTAAARNKGQQQVGFDLSSALWDFDIRFEAALSHKLDKVFLRETENGNSLEQYSRSEEWIPQVVAGIDYAFRYSDDDNVILGVEYFYNEAGYDDASYYLGMAGANIFEFLYNGEHYLAASMVLMAPGSWNDSTFILSALSNLSDESILTRLDYRVRVLTHLNLSFYLAHHGGEIGEMRLSVDGFIPTQTIDAGMGMRVVF